MDWEECEHTNSSRIGNKNVCIGCGLEIEDCTNWTFSYGEITCFKRFPIYSRIKRFITYLKSLKIQELNDNVDDILDVFGFIEFRWMMAKKNKRKYFYNKYVVLFFIAGMLELKSKVRTLKDRERVKQQIVELDLLMFS